MSFESPSAVRTPPAFSIFRYNTAPSRANQQGFSMTAAPKTPEQIAKMRTAGRLAAEVLE